MDRVIETPQDRAQLIRYIENQPLPLTVSVTMGKHRTTAQNRLQRQWMNDLARELPQHTAEEWRGICKLHFGVAIMKTANAEFAEKYDRLIRPLDYDAKLELMQSPMDFPVTRLMTTRQLTAYLDAIQKHFHEQGVTLTDPEGLVTPQRAKVAA